MIKIENAEVIGWEHAIRGMRNPLNSWNKSDTDFPVEFDDECNMYYKCDVMIGENDLDLMQRLAKAGTDHRKYMRMIVVYADVTAPLYFFKEWDTYKVGTVANSCSTMHKIAEKEFTLDDFSIEHLDGHNTETQTTYPNNDGGVDGWYPLEVMDLIVNALNQNRQKYVETQDKYYWWQMIQLLPSSYNQKRTIMLNYEVLANMYHSRKNHKLDEWREFCRWIENLPYSELITGDINNE